MIGSNLRFSFFLYLRFSLNKKTRIHEIFELRVFVSFDVDGHRLLSLYRA